MALPTYSAGSVFLQVVPSYADLQNNLRRDSREIEKALTNELAPSMEKAGREGARRASKALGEELEKGHHKVEVEVETNFKKADRALGSFEKEFKKRLKAATDSLGDGISQELDQIKAEMKTLLDQDIGLDVSSETALAKVRELRNRLEELDNDGVDIQARLDALGAHEALTGLETHIAAVDGKKIEVKADVDTAAAHAKLALLESKTRDAGRAADSGASSFRIFSFAILSAVTVGPALIPILAALAGGFFALGPAIVAAVAGLGVFAFAMSGIGDAVSALGERQAQGAVDAKAHAQAVSAAARTVADAERNLRRAREDAADAAVAAEEAVRDARENAAEANAAAAEAVSEAREQAAEAYEAAVQQEVDAQDALVDAINNVAEAEQALRDAREEARQEEEDLAEQIRQNRIDEREAQLAVAAAQAEYNAAKNDPGATPAEVEQAAITLAQEELNLDEIRDEQGQLIEQQHDFQQNGVSASEGVQDAQDNLTEAIQAQQEAQEALQEASQNTAETQMEGAQNVADAIRDQQETQRDGIEAVQDALAAQAQGAEDSAQAIGDAQRGVNRAQQDYNRTLHETSASQQAVVDAFDKLGPAGRKFALFINGLRDEMQSLRNAAQAGLLPGLQRGIQTLIDRYLPSFRRFVRTMAEVLGDFFAKAGKMFTNKAWERFFGMVERLAPILTRRYGQAFLNWMQVVADLLVIAAPLARHFSRWLLDLSENAKKFVQSRKGSEEWRDFFDYVEKVAPSVQDFFVALWHAAKNLVQALAPLGESILKGLTSFLEFIGNMDEEALRDIAVAILAIVFAVQAISIAGNLATIFLLISSTTAIVIIALAALAVGLYILYQRSETARKIITAAWDAIAAASTWLFDHVIKPLFDFWLIAMKNVGLAVMALWKDAIQPALRGIGAVFTWVWEEIIKPILRLTGHESTDLSDLFDENMAFIGGLFKAFAVTVKWIYNNITKPIFKAIGEAFEFLWKVFKFVWENQLEPMFNAFADIVEWLWKNVWKPTLDLMKSAWRGFSDLMNSVWDNAIKPVFDFFHDALVGGNGDGGLVGVFKSAVKLIGDLWRGLVDIVKKPIGFIIDKVINTVLIGGLNKLAGWLGFDTDDGGPISEIPVPESWLASGGIAPRGPHRVIPGYTPGKDTTIIGVGGGEAVMRPEWTKVYGEDWVNQQNAAARQGGIEAVRRLRMRELGIEGFYAAGGAVGYKGRKIAPRKKRRDDGHTHGDEGGGVPFTYTPPVRAPGSLWAWDADDALRPGVDWAYDIGVPTGTKVGAAWPGTVSVVANEGATSYGKWIELDHGNFQTRYAHLFSQLVQMNQKVLSGQMIAVSDNTGGTSGAHLHFEGDNGAPQINPGTPGGPTGPGIAGPSISLPGWVTAAFSNPLDYLMDLVTGPLDDLKDKLGKPMYEIMESAVVKPIDWAVDWIKEHIPSLGLEGSTGFAPTFGADAKNNQELAYKMIEAKYGRWLTDAGPASPNFLDLIQLWDAESGWSTTATNPSGASPQNAAAYGIPQSHPPSKMASAGADWITNPVTQIEWGLNYIAQTYGTPSIAWDKWLERAAEGPYGWYKDGGTVPEDFDASNSDVLVRDAGGPLPPGLSQVLNLTGETEWVMRKDQLENLAGARNAGDGDTIFDIDLNGTDVTARDVAEELMFEWRRAGRGGRYAKAGG